MVENVATHDNILRLLLLCTKQARHSPQTYGAPAGEIPCLRALPSTNGVWLRG